MSRKRKQNAALPPLSPAAPGHKSYPLKEAFITCRVAAEALYGLAEDCWKNEVCRPNRLAGIFRVLYTAITVPWQDHSFPTTFSSETPKSTERIKRVRGK